MNRRARLLGRGAPLALVALLGLAVVVAVVVPSDMGLELGSANRTRVSGMLATLDQLPPEGGLVVVGFDPDLGTYAEIRPTVRALLADLLERGANLALVSFTPEGRALAVAEMERLESSRLLDLGFRAGAEAALVRAVDRPVAVAAGGPFAALAADGISAADLALVIGGSDIGPRSWVEQVATRRPQLPLAAVTPTVFLPELQPYLASGQLDALLGTVHDGAAYRASLPPAVDPALVDERSIGPLPLLVGMLVALAILGQALVGQAQGGMRAVGR